MPTQASVSYRSGKPSSVCVGLPNEKSRDYSHLIPAAQYVRMSDEAQQYSVDNQKDAIEQYASLHGFTIVKTYSDLGKSGVIAKNRTGLRELLKDVLSGDAAFRAVLVYDVSRWGRFPNNDEAAHYEYICASSGIPLHYCAEPFVNDGTASSSLLKALKRSMASEFSRELGEKIFRGKTRIVQLGFWVGGPPGYGFRRLMLSASGKRKQIMKPGEQKSLTTDRVTLVLGPPHELEIVREMFSMASHGLGPTAIADELNRRGETHYGHPWYHWTVRHIVTNPKYMGSNVWGRTYQRLQTPKVYVEPQHWINKPLAFPPIVDQTTFMRAQRRLPVLRYWTKEKIVKKVGELLKRKGRISEDIIRAVKGMPAPSTITLHLGSYQQLYKELNYRQDTEDFVKSGQFERSMRLRKRLVKRIQRMFPQNVIVTHLPGKHRSMLLVDRIIWVSIMLCRSKQKDGRFFWVIQPDERERDYVTVLCTMNSCHNRVLDFYVLPRMSRHALLRRDVSWLREGVRLGKLSDFYSTVKRLWAQRGKQDTLSRYLQEL